MLSYHEDFLGEKILLPRRTQQHLRSSDNCIQKDKTQFVWTLLFLLLFSCCCLLASLRCNTEKKNTAKGCCRSLSCFILFPYFSVIWSHSQFKPAQVSVPANRKYFALFLTPYPSCTFMPPLLSFCHHKQSRGPPVNTFNNSTEFFFFLLCLSLDQPANAASVLEPMPDERKRKTW